MSLSEPTIMIVDDEESVRASLSMSLEDNYRIVTCETGNECLNRLPQEEVDIVLLDLRMPGLSGEETLEEIKNYDPFISVIIVSAYAEVSNAVLCMKLGAYDIMTKPVDLIHLEGVIRNIFSEKGLSREVEALREELQQFRKHKDIVFSSSPMKDVIQRATKVAQLESDCLLIGETGTGKELIADLIHSQGERAKKPFIVVDCASITQSLVGSTLFGHEKGAFTGANARKIGKFEMAQGGVLFLDEVAHLPKELQPFLLRALESRTIQRVGGNTDIKLDLQIIAATNRDIRELVNEGEYVQDLYFRLMTIPIEIPPLRHRPDDIKTLTLHFLQQFRFKYGCNMHKIQDAALELMQDYAWPGNVRELRYMIEQIMVIYGREETLCTYHLPSELSEQDLKASRWANHSQMNQAIQDVEKTFITHTLDKYKGNISQCARELGWGRNTLYRKMKHYDIEPPRAAG